MSNVGATQLASLIRSLSRNPWLSRNVTKTLDELESLAGRTLDIGHWTFLRTLDMGLFLGFSTFYSFTGLSESVAAPPAWSPPRSNPLSSM
jgi:hypothetical protein